MKEKESELKVKLFEFGKPIFKSEGSKKKVKKEMGDFFKFKL